MRHALALTLSALVLAGCGALMPTPGLPPTGTTVSAAVDAAALGGLASDVAAHPAVQLARPLAYALTPEARPFLSALASEVEPLRRDLAAALKADAAASRGLADWDRSTTSARFAVLQRVAALQGEVMACEVPAVQLKSAGQEAGLMAVYQPGTFGAGTITVYSETLSQRSEYVALSVITHEMRHAAQYQLFTSSRPLSAEEATLADAYEAAWRAADDAGGESALSYGDYVHLNVEYDAFQTGNQVAALVSGTAFQVPGLGFVDVQYNAQAIPTFDLLAIGEGTSGVALISAVNRAQYEAERAIGGSIPRQRAPGDMIRPTDWRNGGGRRGR